MKKLILILPVLMLLSCNHSSGSGDNTVTAKDGASLSASSEEGKGIITCLFDGQQKTFNIKPDFFEIPLDPDGQKDGLEILGEDKKEGFTFEFKKSGTTKIPGDEGCILGYKNPQMISYNGKDVTILVTSYEPTHLTGTFSGKLENVYAETDAKKNPIYSNNEWQV